MADLPPCTRCRHPFAAHRGWNSCIRCDDCTGYLSQSPIIPITIELGEVFYMPGAMVGGVAVPKARVTVIMNDAAARTITVRLDDGVERTIGWESVRTGAIQRG